MLYEILANIKNLVSLSSSSFSNSLQDAVDRQLKAELAEAALVRDLESPTMVATRSQDRDSHAQHAEESQILSGIDTPIPSTGKRKALEKAAVLSTPSFSTKRRKLNGTPSDPDNDMPKTFAAVVIPAITSENADDQEQTLSDGNASKPVPEEGINASPQESGRDPLQATGVFKTGADTESSQKSGGSRSKTPVRREESVANEPVTSMSTTEPSQAVESSAKKSRREDKQMEVTSMAGPSLPDSSPSEVKPNKSKHKRFEGDETIIPPSASVSTNLPHEDPARRDVTQDSEVEISDDEAPDVVSQSTGLQKTRTAAAETAKAIEAQQAMEKQKRKERNDLLERQAKAIKKEAKEDKIEGTRSRTPTDDDNTDQERASPRNHSADFQWSNNDALPELLPNEILAAEPMIRFPTPESLMVSAPINKKHRFLDKTSKPPKDVRNGNVRIRVLEEIQASLAPKVSKPSQRIRESWLAGRTGAKGRVVMERRKMGSGFVRR